MERQPRAHFGVYKVNRLTLLVLGLLLVALATYRYNPIQKVSSVVDRYTHSRADQGVALDGKSLAGKNADDLRRYLTDYAKSHNVSPRDAAIDPVTKGVIPELNGRELDVDATIEKVLRLPANSVVRPVYRDLPPAKTIKDFTDRPVYHGNPAKHAVGLVINVAWGEKYLPEMLKTLAKHNAKATFFVVGRWADAHPDLLKDIAFAGHDIANHGYDDRLEPAKLTRDKLIGDIQKGAQAIKQITGIEPVYYSPHMGQATSAVTKAASDLKLRTVMWSVDTRDWQEPGVATITNAVLKAQPGAIVLLHPKAQTAQALEGAVTGLQSRGYSLLAMRELLSPSPTAPVAATTER